jgi:hypothetical protein
MTFDASIVLVSDYKAGDRKSSEDLRSALTALARQDHAGPFEIVLVESRAFLSTLPNDLGMLAPNVRIIASDGVSSYALKNHGAREAMAPIVLMLDADCVPEPGWVGACLAAFSARPDAVVVSGLTRYPGRTVTERCLGLLDRAYVDRGDAGDITRISNNNAGYRRAAYLKAPLPEDAGAFASPLQARAILAAGGALVFEPTMIAVHDFEGWPMERDARRALAHGLIAVRRRDPGIRFAWILRLGRAGVPLMVLGRFAMSLRACLTVGHHYGVRPWQVPFALALAAFVHVLEIPGYLTGLRNEPIPETVYR